MSELYRSFFALKREPFGSDLRIEELMETAATELYRGDRSSPRSCAISGVPEKQAFRGGHLASHTQ